MFLLYMKEKCRNNNVFLRLVVIAMYYASQLLHIYCHVSPLEIIYCSDKV